ncbi:MAG TPA: S8 family serine peptidase [Actinomycetes bacterium]
MGSGRGGTNSWYDPNGEHPTTPTDRNGHGTWTMGAMVGGDAGGTAIGVAPDARWIAVKIFNDRGTTTSTMIHRGFQWLLDPDGNPATADAPNVVNDSWTMSVGGCNLDFQLDLRNLRAAGVLPVFSAGNYGPLAGTVLSPANNPEAFAVGATDDTDVLAPSSSRGPSACPEAMAPKLVAPGVGVRASDLYGSYLDVSGTSIAAPQVAGALALLLDAFPGLSADQQAAALEGGALDLGVSGPDGDFGSGRLDVLAAYQWLARTPGFTLAAAPFSVTTLQGGTASYDVVVGGSNGFTGAVALSLTGLSAAQASWSFDPPVVQGGSGVTQLTVTTAATMAPGSYPLTITGTSGSLVHSAQVTLVVPAPPDFTLAAGPASQSVAAGDSAVSSVVVGSANGFAGQRHAVAEWAPDRRRQRRLQPDGGGRGGGGPAHDRDRGWGSGGQLPAHRDRDQRVIGPLGPGHAGGDSAGRLRPGCGPLLEDGVAWRLDQLDGDHRLHRRVRGDGEPLGGWVAVGGDGRLQPGHGRRAGRLHAHGQDRRQDPERDLCPDGERQQRVQDPSGNHDVDRQVAATS